MLPRQILTIEYVGKVAREDEIVLEARFRLLLKGQIFNLGQLCLEWVVRGEK